MPNKYQYDCLISDILESIDNITPRTKCRPESYPYVPLGADGFIRGLLIVKIRFIKIQNHCPYLHL